MKTPLHLSLLKQLKEAGIGVMKDISPFIDSHFDKPENPEHWKEAMRPPILFLRDLINRGFVKLEENDEYLGVIMEPNFNFVKWFTDIDIRMYITSEGLDYLDQYKNNTLLKKANKAIIASLFVTLILSIVTVVLTALNFNLSKESFIYTKKNDSAVKALASTFGHTIKKTAKTLT